MAVALHQRAAAQGNVEGPALHWRQLLLWSWSPEGLAQGCSGVAVKTTGAAFVRHYEMKVLSKY